ncbi:DUF6185 family protein [Streptomyces aureus]|uniref:DUF6185 family protein n=1 Tax=Streptomyces aureus TaxID=193461 RepID=UPI001FD75B67|nr:DUF6185 family protein [Streptomyces aureus]
MVAFALFFSFTSVGGVARAADDACFSGQLVSARVTASVRMTHSGEDYTKAEGRLSVTVPRSWRLSEALLLNGDTERYRSAMRCLLREVDDPFPYRDTEGRPRPPRITVQKKWVSVEQRVTTWVNNRQQHDFGVWRMTEGKRLWTLELLPPQALSRSWWQRVSVDLGGRPARRVSPAPTTGSDAMLVWIGKTADGSRPTLKVGGARTAKKAGGAPPAVRITLQPPAAKALATWWNEDPGYLVYPAAWLPWDLLVLALLLFVVRALRRDPGASPPGRAERRTVRNLRNFGCLMFALTVVCYFDDPLLAHLANDSTAVFWTDRHRVALHLALTLATGLCLCAFGRPGRMAVAAVTAAASYVTVVVLRPGWLTLPGQLVLNWDDDQVEPFREAGGMYTYAAACACLVLIWLVGATASLLRLLRSCDAPAAVSPQGRFPHSVLGVLLLVAAAVATASLWSAENRWLQQSWLSRHAEALYEPWHVSSVFDDFRMFPSNWLDWFFGSHFWWWGPSVAIVAVLRARAVARGRAAAFPSASEELSLRLFFTVVVTPVVGIYAGVPFPLPSLLALWLAITALLAYGRKRAVLHRPLRPGHPLHKEIRESSRRRLHRNARRHRELHAQLRRLEQGQQDGDRARIEQELDRLHRLPYPSQSGPSWVRLPSGVGPVELALAWGPRATWWGNARRAAYFAALFALPADVVSLWAEQLRGSLWNDTFTQPFGFAELMASVITDEVTWVGAGFMLGALWRVLPGRRGPVRAIALSLVYTAPVLVQWIGTEIVDQSFSTWALNLSLTLLVLTLTAVAMDIDTFRWEGHYWPNKAGLLLSVYQWRTASVQLAFLIAQFVALVSIWQQLKGGEPMVLIQHDPSDVSGGGGSSSSP